MNIILKYFSIALFAIITLSSCKPSAEKESKTEVNLPAKLETVSINIEGMTCEVGCAKTIQSKISKLEGVSESKVNFEDKKGTFTYDANTTSEEKIIEVVNGLLDGKTYSATLGKEKSCSEACAKECGHELGEVCKKNDSEKKHCSVSEEDKAKEACHKKCETKKERCNKTKKECEADAEKSCCKAA